MSAAYAVPNTFAPPGIEPVPFRRRYPLIQSPSIMLERHFYFNVLQRSTFRHRICFAFNANMRTLGLMTDIPVHGIKVQLSLDLTPVTCIYGLFGAAG